MKKLAVIILLLSQFLIPSQASVSPDQAKVFIEKLISEGILYWKDKPFDQQVAKFKEVMETKFDLDGIAKRTLGEKLWKYMDEKQKKEFLASFRQMLLNRYSKKFSQYGGQSIVVTDSAPSMKTFPVGVSSNAPQPQIVVTSELRNSGGAPVKVEWYVGEEHGKPIITDITMAGPSMVSTEQATFAAIQRNPENLAKAREVCKAQGGDQNKCIADCLKQKITEYMLNSN